MQKKKNKQNLHLKACFFQVQYKTTVRKNCITTMVC